MLVSESVLLWCCGFMLLHLLILHAPENISRNAGKAATTEDISNDGDESDVSSHERVIDSSTPRNHSPISHDDIMKLARSGIVWCDLQSLHGCTCTI